MMRRRSSSGRRNQRAISSRVRPQPSHRPVSGSMRQTLMQGLEARVMAEVKAPIGLSFNRDQESDEGENLGRLLDGAGDVPGLAADEPRRQARQRLPDRVGEDQHQA